MCIRERFDTNYFLEFYNKREELLEGIFDLVDLDNYSKCSVIAFLDENQYDTQMSIKDDIVLEIKLPYQYQKQMIHLSYKDLKTKVHNEEYGTNPKYILTNSLIKTEQINIIKETIAHDKNINETHINEEKQSKVEIKNSEEIICLPQTPMNIKFGTNIVEDKEILWYPTNSSKTLNTNTGIIGTMGTGKTQFTKSVITQIIKNSINNVNSTPIDILIFNYKAEDYLDEKFVKATNAKIYEPYHLPFNPLALFGKKPLLPVHTANLFKTTLSKTFGLGQVQQSNLNRIILKAYESKGIEKINMNTWSNPAPTINDLWEIYNTEEKIQVDSLYAALEKLSSFEIFEPDTSKTKSLFDMMDGVTVINIAQYDPDIQNLIVAITLDIFYTQMQIKGASKQKDGYRELTKMILVDEADNFMSQDFESLRKILKEGREFGVGTILSTQQLTHFKTAENDYADYILSWIIHKVDKIKLKDIESVFNVSTKNDSDQIMSQIRQLKEHHSLYINGKKEIQKMRDLAFWELFQ
jgi:DNA phosphorothioation-dependent restriction protein DptH